MLFDLTTLGRNLWLMEPRRLEALLREAARRELPRPRELRRARKAAAERLRKVSGKVAVLPLHGVVEHRYSAWSYLFGGCSTEAVGLALDYLKDSKECGAVLLDIDSPGGGADGVEELADKIQEFRAAKPVYGIANTLCASAAYWLASQCSNLYCTPSGEMGSVGVYMLHMDHSQALEQVGVKPTFVHAGKYKTEGNPYEPLGEDARAAMQEDADALYSKFCKAVARGRGVSVEAVRRDFGQGRLLDAAEAAACKMCDGVLSYGELLARLGVPHPKAERARPSMAVLRGRHELARSRAPRTGQER